MIFQYIKYVKNKKCITEKNCEVYLYTVDILRSSREENYLFFRHNGMVFFKAVQDFFEESVALGEVEADEVVDRFAEEGRARYGGDADFAGQFFTERRIVIVTEFGDVDEDIVRSFWFRMRDVQAAQATAEEVPFFRVDFLEFIVVRLGELEADEGSFHEGAGSADSEEVVDFLGSFDDFRRSDNVAETPARDGVGFR